MAQIKAAKGKEMKAFESKLKQQGGALSLVWDVDFKQQEERSERETSFPS
jgi:hypothetical protein